MPVHACACVCMCVYACVNARVSALTALHGVSGVSAVVSDQKITTEKEAPQPEKLMEATKMMKLSVTYL